MKRSIPTLNKVYILLALVLGTLFPGSGFGQLLEFEEVRQLDTLRGIHLRFGPETPRTDSLFITLANGYQQAQAFVAGSKVGLQYDSFTRKSADKILIQDPPRPGRYGTIISVQRKSPSGVSTPEQYCLHDGETEFLLYDIGEGQLHEGSHPDQVIFGANHARPPDPYWEIRFIYSVNRRGKSKHYYIEGEVADNDYRVPRHQGFFPLSKLNTDSIRGKIVLYDQDVGSDEVLSTRTFGLKNIREGGSAFTFNDPKELVAPVSFSIKYLQPKVARHSISYIYPQLESVALLNREDTLVEGSLYHHFKFRFTGFLDSITPELASNQPGIYGYFKRKKIEDGVLLDFYCPKRDLLFRQGLEFSAFHSNYPLGKKVSIAALPDASKDFAFVRLAMSPRTPDYQVVIMTGDNKYHPGFSLPKEKSCQMLPDGRRFLDDKSAPKALAQNKNNWQDWQENIHKDETVSIFVFANDTSRTLLGHWSGQFSSGGKKSRKIKVKLDDGESLAFRASVFPAQNISPWLDPKEYSAKWNISPQFYNLDTPANGQVFYYQVQAARNPIFR